MAKEFNEDEYQRGKTMAALRMLQTIYEDLPESEKEKARSVREVVETKNQIAELFKAVGVGWDASDQELYLPDAVERNADALIYGMGLLVRSLRAFVEPFGYTDDELRQLATTSSGRGEIDPNTAAKVIQGRAALEGFEGYFDEAG